MAGNEILIRWASESSAAIRDMAKVERALSDTLTAQEKRARRWDTANKVMRGATIAWTGAVVLAAKQVGNYIKLAQEDAKAQAVLTQTLKNTTGATDAQAQALSDFIDAAARATLFTDDQLRPAMGNLLRATGDQAESQRLLNIAMDAATSTGKDVSSVTAAMGKAYNGNVAALKRLFPFIKDSTVESNNFAAAMRQIERNTKGAADAAARNSPFEKFMQDLDELKESIGKAFNTKGFQNLIGDIDDALNDLADFSERNPDALVNIAKGIGAITASLWAIQGATAGIAVLRTLGKVLGSFGPMAGVGIIVGEIIALKQALKDVGESSPAALKSLQDFWDWNPFEGGWWGSQLLDWIQGFQDSSLWQGLRLGLAQVTDALGITNNRYEALKEEFSKPAEATLTADNKRLLGAAADAGAALDRVDRKRPNPKIDANNRAALGAAADAASKINGIKQDRPVRIDADTSAGRTEVNNFRAWVNSLGASVSVGVRVNRTVVTQQVNPSPSSSSSDARASSIQSAPVINVNGFGGDPDTVARRVVSALSAAETRYNQASYAR